MTTHTHTHTESVKIFIHLSMVKTIVVGIQPEVVLLM